MTERVDDSYSVYGRIMVIDMRSGDRRNDITTVADYLGCVRRRVAWPAEIIEGDLSTLALIREYCPVNVIIWEVDQLPDTQERDKHE